MKYIRSNIPATLLVPGLGNAVGLTASVLSTMFELLFKLKPHVLVYVGQLR